MNKHALMLTVATVALMAGPAFADTTITSKETTAQKTSTANGGAPDNIVIGTGGSVVITAASPAVEIDSTNWVSNSVSGATISNKDTSSAIGVQLDATAIGTNGNAGGIAFDNYGTIDLTGTGSSKIGILVNSANGSGDTFLGDIQLESGSKVSVKGDGSYGLQIEKGAKLDGNVTILGQILVNPTSTTSTSAGAVTGALIAGDVTGDITVGSTGAIQGIGYNATGLYISGVVSGALANSGSIEVVGTRTPKSTGGNPEAGSALVVANDINGGIFNDGPSPTASSTTSASIGIKGTGPAVYIAPATGRTTDMTIGAYTGDSNAVGYSVVNRGSITAASQDPNVSETAINMVGASTAHLNLSGGIFNSGTISATATSDGKLQNPYNATALYISQYVNVTPGAEAALYNASQGSGGQIRATVSGSTGGTATAVYIGTNSTLVSLNNEGTISASASTTDTTITNTLAAYAINDASGSLKTITNSGNIIAGATTLDSDAQVTVAANLAASTQDITFTNSGNVTGDIKFGSGADALSVNGTAGGSAVVNGDIAFGGTLSSGGYDTLNIGTTGTGAVTGAVTEANGGQVNVTIGGAGTLTLQNTDSSLLANNLIVQNGGTMNISLSNGFNQAADATNPALVMASKVNFGPLSTLNVSFGSFVSTPGGTAAQFTLFNSTGAITFGDSSAIQDSITSTVPYLFNGTLCGYGIAGFTNPASCTATPANNELVLTLAPKTAAQVGLTGNASNIFTAANDALANDDALGSAIVTYVTDATTAQAAYSSFVPDLSGATRAVAISITDQATGPVGARQRALRMYANQPGGTTMWGQEFANRITSGTNTDAFRASGFGFALGVDSGSPEAGRYGAAFTFYSGDQTNKGPNFTKTTNEWYMLTGYTDWRGKGMFLDTQLGFGYGNLNGRRTLQLENGSGTVVLTRRAKSKRAGLLLSGGVSTGAVFTYGGTVLTPQVSIDGLTMREEGYTETGGGDGMNLKVQPYYANSLRGYAGATVRQDIDFGGWFIQPEARIGYRYDFLADPVKLKAAFASVGNNFTLTGADPERGNIVGGASLAVTTGAWSLGVNYDYLRGNKGEVTQSGIVTLVGRI